MEGTNIKKLRIAALGIIFGICICSNIFWTEAREKKETVRILATQEVENESKNFGQSADSGRRVSIYYNEAKGWIFNDIIYMDGCATYGSSYGGTPTGMLSPGYYRFVKSNGSYVALCEVNLVQDCEVRKAYGELWNKYGGMWSWEQALYNQLDGTPELEHPTDIKSALLENGRRVSDITQNYRFIKCWIKIEDLRTNPETETKEFEQTIRYYVRNKETGEITEWMEMSSREKVREKTTYQLIPQEKEGYRIDEIRMNGVKKENGAFSYEVLQDNEICIYYSGYQLKVRLHANDGSGKVQETTCYFPEIQVRLNNTFERKMAVFLGWSISENGTEILYEDGETVGFDLRLGDVVLDLYGVWDVAPEVNLPLLYFYKEELLNQEELENYVLSFGSVKDDTDGTIFPANEGRVTILTDIRADIQEISEGWVAYRIEVSDEAGNRVQKWCHLYIVDTTAFRLGESHEKIRFVTGEYMYTMDEQSIWVSNPEYYQLLCTCMEKEKGIRWKKTAFGWQMIK